MFKVARIASCAFLAFFLGVATSDATLIDRGSGLIYDDLLDVTWLQDANYAQTSGAAPFGRLTWGEGVAWANSLQYVDTVRGVVWDDWRLPTTINSPDSVGFDVSGQSSELASLYYLSLGFAPNTTGDQTAPSPTSSNYNPFINLNYRGFWSGTQADNPTQAWYLHFHFGYQGFNSGSGDSLFVWAVRDGDVARVPEPGTLSLLALGFIGITTIRRKTS